MGAPRTSRLPAILLLVLGSLVAFPPAARGQDADECLSCHEDPDLTGERDGKEIPVHVDPDAFRESVHGDLACVACHRDLEGTDYPHRESTAPVDCGPCHDEQAEEYRQTIHGIRAAKGDRLAPTCATCHGRHDILPASNPRSRTAIMNIPLLCGECHHEGSPVSRTHDIPEERILENYSQSIHGEGLFRKGLTVTAVCTSCHTSHRILPHTDPRSSIHPHNVARTCTKCHARIEDVHKKVIEGRLWEEAPHKIPACTDCHSPHRIRKPSPVQGAANRDCFRCHSNRDLYMVRNGERISLYVDEAAWNASRHSGVACAQCHTEVNSAAKRPCSTIRSPVDCSICHAEVVRQYEESAHGRLAASGDPDAPRCLTCHDPHATEGQHVPTSNTYPRNVPDLCGRCHARGGVADRRLRTPIDIVASYRQSIHGKGLLESGLVVTATCTDCHTAHHVLPPDDPDSSVNPSLVADTCGNCHRGIEEAFRRSVHWPGNTRTDRRLPTCEDCHTSHQIARTDRPGFRTWMMEQCGNCHHDEADTFFETPHGKASQLGDERVAKCFDCHGTHDILPVDDPRSTLSPTHVVQTCRKCHEGAHLRFAGYLSHATHHDPKKYPWLFWTFWGMTSLLVGTLVFFSLHTVLWLWRLWRTREQWRPLKARAARATKFYRRFDARQRAMHLVMMLSFFTLAVTGMTLKFSYMTWAQVLSRLLGGFEVTSVLHRIAAVVLISDFLYHLHDLNRRRREEGRSWLQLVFGPGSMMFTVKDIRDFIGTVKWFLGAGPRPRYGRFTYWEKFDYFAVFWGVFVIGSTGLILWFPEFFTRFLPGWAVNVATIIHSDEALLAVGFIFTIHFFNTHFRPDKFPMDPVIFTGRVPLEELRHDKPEEYEEAKARGTLEERLVDPIPAPVERAFRVFGFTMLGIGLVLIAFIVYTMLFGYR